MLDHPCEEDAAVRGRYTIANAAVRGHKLQLMRFLEEEVDGALVMQKIRGTAFSENIPTTETLHIDTKSGKKPWKHKDTSEPF